MENGQYFKFLRIIGVDPQHKISAILVFVSSILTLNILTMAFLEIYFYDDLLVIEAISACLHVTIKYGALIIHRNDIINMLKASKDFWETDMTDAKIIWFMQYERKLQKILICVATTGFCVFVVKPFALQSTSVFGGYHPSQIPFALYYSLEFIFTLYGVLSFLGFNLLICNLIMSVAIQFRLLNLRIMDLDFELASRSVYGFEKCKNELKKLVEYHLSLIRYVQMLNQILSMPVALMISITVCFLCVNMYVIFSSKVSSQLEWVRLFVTSCALILEFSLIYGFPSQLLMNEAEETSTTIYTECNWYLPNIVPLRKCLLMMMIRSQRSISIRAANYHIVNNRTIVLMLKTAYSFCTFIQTIT